MFKNKVAVIVGGNGGLGKAISTSFLKNGCKVLSIYRGDDKKAEKVTKELSKIGDFSAFKLDISKEDEVKAFFAKVKKCDFLVNCAGISIEKPFEELTMEEIRKVMDVNLFGKMNCSKYALPLLKKSKSGRIVSISSRFAYKPFFDGMMGYSVAEAGTVMMSKVLALECAKYGIKVNTVCASLTITPHTLEICTKEEIETISKKNPSGRLGKPEDVANLVTFLCKNESDYITGEDINVNGGILLI